VTPPADFDENYLQQLVGVGGQYFARQFHALLALPA